MTTLSPAVPRPPTNPHRTNPMTTLPPAVPRPQAPPCCGTPSPIHRALLRRRATLSPAVPRPQAPPCCGIPSPIHRALFRRRATLSPAVPRPQAPPRCGIPSPIHRALFRRRANSSPAAPRPRTVSLFLHRLPLPDQQAGDACPPALAIAPRIPQATPCSCRLVHRPSIGTCPSHRGTFEPNRDCFVPYELTFPPTRSGGCIPESPSLAG